MFRFSSNATRSLDSLPNLITDLVADGLLFFRILFRSRTTPSAEVLFLRKQLAFLSGETSPTKLIGYDLLACPTCPETGFAEITVRAALNDRTPSIDSFR